MSTPARPLRVPWSLSAAALLAAACGKSIDSWEPTFDAPYSAFDDESFAALKRARVLSDAGDWDEAWRVLDAAWRADEDNLDIGAVLQEIEYELLVRGTEVDGELALRSADADHRGALFRRWDARADDAPSIPRTVLRARVEPDALAALNGLDEALERDPRCAWAWYGRAHTLLRLTRETQRWRLAREALDACLALDPGHLRARRLEAWILAQEGGDAAPPLQAWLEAAQGDPRISRTEYVDTQLDLARTWVLEGSPKRAAKLLRSMEGEPIGRGRRLAILACAQQALGDEAGALDSARRAEGAGETEVLALVQQAVLYQHYLDRPDQALEQWADVAEKGSAASDLSAILQSLRARIMLERAAPESAP